MSKDDGSTCITARREHRSRSIEQMPVVLERAFAGLSLLGDADHHVRGLDDGVGLLADLQGKLVYGLVGDGSCDDRAADVYANVGRRCALADFDDLALETIAGADLHSETPLSS